MKDTYLEQFKEKERRFLNFFEPLAQEVTSHDSPEVGFRSRAEFGVFIKNNSLNYFMIKDRKKETLDNLEICHPKINDLMDKLKTTLKNKTILLDKLFSCGFQVSKKGESIICLNYHKEIDQEWRESANGVANLLKTNLIGRSRKKKITIGKDFIKEKYDLGDEDLKINLYENCFSQPNPYVCEKILQWTRDVKSHEGDILELHCGIGTFTLLLSRLYNQVLATENSRPSIRGLEDNIKVTSSINISHARLSGKETLEALNGKRDFRRLSNINIKNLKINSVFLDPPRTGLDEYTKTNIQKFDTIFYISCGFESLKKDLQSIKTHRIKKASFFDQFPYTDHMESAILLERI
tara:strand:- start:51 stop:1103 length:1053 start_codon:yes stop_codon:yes gene_type:complete